MVDWVHAGLFLIFGIAWVAMALLRPGVNRLQRIGMGFLGVAGLFVFLAMVSSDGEFMPWGFMAVLCAIVGIIAGIGSRIKRWSDPTG